MKNQAIAKVFYNIADLLEIQNVKFKPQAYRKAARIIENLDQDISKIKDLKSLAGVGEHLAQKIKEILKTGKLKYYQKLKKEVGIDIEKLKDVPTLGPKKIKLLHEKFGIKNLKDLEKALKQNQIQKIEGFGKESIKNIKEGIKIIKSRPNRFLYFEVEPIVQEILEYFKEEKIEVAGSFRRGKETIGDLDFLITTNKPKKVIDKFLKFPKKKIINQGLTKSSILLKNNLQVDLRVVKDKEFGSALLYFIGNREHNIALRKHAISLGYKLSEYGLFIGKKLVAGKTQEEIYKKLKLQYIPPEIRQNVGEIDLAKANKIPKLIEKKDLKGVFHNHSTWSDGINSIEEMTNQANNLKLKFISFNDHFGPLKITNPLDKKRLNSYLKEIDKIKSKTNIKILSGLEIDILKDGTLPLSKKKLKELDVVIGAIHLSTKMNKTEMTKRICKAMQNYPINILAHPTDRLINKRPELKLDLENIFKTAKNTNTFLEINSSPQRLDLPSNYIKTANDIGCKFAIGTDAHAIDQIEFYRFGIINARRGFLTKNKVLNCFTLPKIKKELK